MGQLFLSNQPFPLLLGLAEDTLAMPAARVTHALAKERGAEPAVVQVFDPTPYAAPGPIPTMVVFAEALIGPGVSEERRLQLRDRLKEITGEPIQWPVEILFGTPVACITSEAKSRSSELIVVGLHTRGKLSSLLGAETAIKIMERVDIPVLAVTPTLVNLPHKILAAVDFSHASLHAARLAARLVESGGTVTLAYAQPPVSMIPEDTTSGAGLIHHQGIITAFNNLREEIAEERSITVDTVLLHGDPAQALMDHAAAIAADLIAIGSQRHNFLERLLVGSVTRKIVRDGRWSVLMVPPASV